MIRVANFENKSYQLELLKYLFASAVLNQNSLVFPYWRNTTQFVLFVFLSISHIVVVGR